MADVARAQRAHDALVYALASLSHAEKNVTLAFAEVLHGEHFRPLGYSSIHHYAKEGLKLSHAKTMQFVRLAQDMKRLPALEKAVASGEIPWTKARTVGAVATPENQDEWVKLAKTQPRRELERQAKQARGRMKAARAKQPNFASRFDSTPNPPQGDPPRRVSFELTSLQAAQFDKLMESARRQGSKDTATLLLASLESYVSQQVTRVNPASKTTVKSRPAAQVVLYKCESCSGVEAPVQRGTRQLQPAEAKAALCDVIQIGIDGRKRSKIPPRIRTAVLARDKHSCKRCKNTSFVDVHHIQRQESEGAHALENCVSLCRACHVNWHREEERLISAGVSARRVLELAREFAYGTSSAVDQ